MEKISHDEDAPTEAIEEAKRRNANDGIPRHVYESGKIMKWDWELHEELLQGDRVDEAIEDHIRRLMDGQQG